MRKISRGIRRLSVVITLISLVTMLMSPGHAQLVEAKDPYLDITKKAEEKNANPGEQIRFEIEAEVREAPTATNVVITDDIPDDTSFVSATGGGVYDDATRTVTWNLPLLVEGEKPSFDLILRVNGDITANKVTNVASMTSDDNFEDTDKATDSDFVNIKDAPFITLAKSAGVSFVKPGDQLTFNIDYANEGNDDAKGVVLSDVLPPFTTFVDATLGGVYDAGTNTVTWPEDDIDEGSGGGLLLIVSIDADAPNDTVITNTVKVTGENVDPSIASTSVTVQLAPILQLTKSADVSFVSPGQNITYLLEYSNTGNASATDVVLEDAIPAFTTYVSATGGGTFDGTKVTWSGPELVAGEAGSVSLTVRVNPDVTPSSQGVSGDVIVNVASLSSSNAAPALVENRVPVIEVPLMDITKTANAEFVKAGTNVTYTLHYENSGTATAENVVIEDILPEFTSFITATGGGQLQGDRVVWTDPGLTPGAVGQVQLVLAIADSLAEGTQVTNTASLTSDNSSPVAGSDSITVRNAPILQITKTANVEFVQPGDQVVYTLEFTNVGNVDAQSVTIEDLVPVGTTFVSASGDGVFADGRVNWAFPYLGVGQVGSVNLVLTVDADTIDRDIQNNVTIDSANALAASASNIVTSESKPILTLIKEANLAFVDAGEQVTFTLSYENTGNTAANNVILQDFLPALTTFVSATGGGIYDPVNNVVNWSDPSLSVGASGQVQLTLEIFDNAPDDSVIVNSSTIVSDGTSPVTASDSVIVKLSPELLLTKSADVDVASPGELITFTLSFANTGNATATTVVLEDLIPTGTSFVSASGGGVFDGDAVRWDLADLAVAETGSVSLTVSVNADQVSGDYIDNVATLDSDNAFAVSASDQVVVSLLPELTLSKTTSSEFVIAGEQVTFNLNYENTGNTAAVNVVLTDEIPLGTSFVSATGGGQLVGSEVVWTDPGLDPGAVGQVQITLLVSDLAEDDATIINSATLTSDQTPPNSDSASIIVKRTPVLGLEKTASVDLVDPGDEVTYTLNYDNTGNATAVALLLEDPVPVNTTFVSATAGGVLTDGIVRWTGNELASGDGGAVAMTVRVDPLAEDGQVISNTATFDSDNAYAVTSGVNVIVQKRPVLTLIKTAVVQFVEAGEIASFTLVFENTGNAAASDLVIEDAIPVGATFSSASSGGTYDPVSNMVSWSFASLPVGQTGEVSISMLVDDTLAEGTVITNSATIDSELTQPVTASDRVVIKRSPLLSLEKEANVEFIGPGENMTFLLEYDNLGNAEAIGAILEDPIPANTSFVSATGGGVFADGKVTWNIPSLPVNSPGSVSMTVLVDPASIVDDINSLQDGTIIQNTATLDSPDAYAVAAEASVVVKLSPSLSIEKTADTGIAVPGTRITYELTVVNTGNVTATNLVLEDNLPDDITFISASDGGVESAGIVTWNLASLGVGESATVSLIVEVDSPLDDGTTIFNSSSLYSDQTAPVSAEHTLNVQSAPQLSLLKSADKSVVKPGEEITYNLTIENTGNANTRGLLFDIIPNHTTFVSASNGGVQTGGVVSWILPSILVGEPQLVTMTVLVDTPLDNNTRVLNLAALGAEHSAPVLAVHELIVQSSPVLTLDKTVDMTAVTPGSQLVYTLTYGNVGNANAENVILSDAIPANTSFVSASDGGVEAAGKVTWNIAALNAGASGTVTLTVLVDTPLDNGTVIYNLASVEADEASPVTDDTTSTVQSAPVLELENTADAPLVEAGGQIIYTLSYANNGNANTSGVTLTDWLPANTSFVSASDGGTESGGVVSWPINTLAAGESASVTLTVNVDSPLDNATRLFNIASLNSTEGQPDTGTALVVVQSTPVLTLVKTANVSLAQPADLITYTLTFGNTGNANASNYVLSDAVPANTTFDSATGGGIESGGVVTWSGAQLLAGSTNSVTMTVQIDTPLNNGVVINNMATLMADRATDVFSNVDVTIESAPVLSLDKTASASVVQPGDLLTYTLSLENSGNANATSVVLQDIVPPNTSFVAATGGGVEVGGVVTWNASELPVGVPASVTMTVQLVSPLPNGTMITNSASLVSDQTALINDDVTVTVSSAPVLKLVKTADKMVVKPGEQITYTLTVGNNGNANATNVVLDDTIPAFTTFVSASGGGVEQNGVVTWSTPELLVGSSGSVTLTVQVDSPLDNGIQIYNRAKMGSDQTTSVDADVSVTVNSAPVLSLVKTAEKTVVNPGDQITYTLALGNSGNANASNIVLEDTIPANTSFVSATGGGTESGDVVIWTTPELLAGVGGSVTLTVLVDTPLDNGTPIYNSATLSSDETNPLSADNSLAVQSAPVLTLVKTADKTVVNPGDQITYTLTLGNTGNANASNVLLEDTIPDNTSFVSASAGGTEVGGVVSWTTPELLAGVDGSVTLTVLVDTPLDNGTPIYNSATLSSDESNPVSADNNLAVQSAPVLTLVKTADKTVVNPGEQITYTLSLGNSGNANASNVVLQDRIPNHTSFVSATGGGSEADGLVTWTTPSLPAGENGSVTLTVVVDSPLANGTSIENSASIYSEDTTPVSASLSLPVQSTAVLTLDKTADKTVVNPGDQITYTLTFSNTGNANATNVMLEDILPANTSFVSATAGGTEAGGIVSWPKGPVNAGSSGSVALTVLVDAVLDNGTAIHNTASLESDQTAPISADHTLFVQSAPVLTLEKEADTALASPGDLITYKIDFSNSGNANASGVTLIDQLPVNTSFVSATGGGIEASGIVTWPVFQLSVGASGTVFVVVSVDSPLENATLLHNVAELSSSGLEAPVSAFADVVVQSVPTPEISKTADVAFVQRGEQISYAIKYANTGTSSLQNTVLIDQLPTGTTFVSASNEGVFDGSRITWNIGQLNAGASGVVNLVVQADNSVNDGDVISNVAALYGSNAQPVTDVSSVPVLGAANLNLTKTTTVDIVEAGDQLVYTMSYVNNGNSVATGLVLEDELPLYTSFVAASNGGSFSGGVVTWNLADLSPGLPQSVTLTVQIDADAPTNTEINNTASLNGDNTLPVSASRAVVIFDPIDGTPVLRIQLTPDRDSIMAGEDIVYTAAFQNETRAGALDVEIVALLPGSVEFVSADNGGTPQSVDGVTQVYWNIGTLAGLSGGQVTYTVRHIDSTMASNEEVFGATVEKVYALATISASNALPGSSDADSATVTVLPRELPPEKLIPVPVFNRPGLFVLVLLMLGFGFGFHRRTGLSR